MLILQFVKKNCIQLDETFKIETFALTIIKPNSYISGAQGNCCCCFFFSFFPHPFPALLCHSRATQV